MELPKDFVEQTKALLGNAFQDFKAALETSAPTSVRYHPEKSTLSRPISDPVMWHTRGAYLTLRPVFTLDPCFHAGSYYVQEASSMFVAHALSQLLDTAAPLMALDLTAAPGGKSTLIAEFLSSDSLLVANEVIRSRFQALYHNHIKWGYPNVICTNHDPADFTPLAGYFDLVLVDAPCSGEGLFRKDPDAVNEWSPKAVAHCHRRQKRILQDAAPLVKEGGYLLYSTCTFNTLENHASVAFLVESGHWKNIRLSVPEKWGIQETEYGYQFFPHRIRGEGFFFSVFQKLQAASNAFPKKRKVARNFLSKATEKEKAIIEEWIPDHSAFHVINTGHSLAGLPENIYEQALPILQSLNRRAVLLEMGTLKGSQLIPSPNLAMSLVPVVAEELSLEKEEALRYLKGEPLSPRSGKKGWLKLTYQHLCIGWGKAIPNRINNYYPKDWRIRMRI